MPLDDLNTILTRYQAHFGAYDKAKWEQSVEERILHGINHISTKSAKLGTDLIDIDLVQGSSFPKAKPKHGLFTVTRQALLRFLFLPLYYEWWSTQTSSSLFCIFSILYTAQLVNLILFITTSNTSTIQITPGLISNIFQNESTDHHTLVSSSSGINPDQFSSSSEKVKDSTRTTSHNGFSSNLSTSSVPVETSDILSPFFLMLILTLLHTQIVSTHWQTSSSSRLITSSSSPTKTNTVNGNSTNPNRSPTKNRIIGKRRNSLTKGRKIGRRGNLRIRSNRRISSINQQQVNSINCIAGILNGGNTSGNVNEHLLVVPASIPRKSNSTSSLSPSTSKKVLFVENYNSVLISETKNIHSPSNSDRDEGIHEELLVDEDNSLIEHGNSFKDEPIKTYGVVSDPIIQKNLNDTLNQFTHEQNLNVASTALLNDSNAIATEDESITGAVVGGGGSKGTNCKSTICASVSCGGASTLRFRNLSKHSVSTTTPSVSGEGECWSSGKDDETSSDDEAEEGTNKRLDSTEEIRNTSKFEEQSERFRARRRIATAELIDDEEEVRKSEWTAVTTNSEDEDYVEEEVNNSEEDPSEIHGNDDPFAWEFHKHGGKVLTPSCASSDKVSCTLWEGNEAKKADLTVLDISALIIAKVERAKENSDYLYLGIFCSCVLAFLPICWRLNWGNFELIFEEFELSMKTTRNVYDTLNAALGEDTRSRVMLTISCSERLCLSLCVFFLLAVAEKTYKQRFLYSKLFSRITSTRKSKKSGIPHFRLNKVRNIKTWLCIRSYLQRRGPQRSVDTIVSATFIAAIILICFLSVELLKDSSRLYYLYNLEVIGWTLCLGFYLLRFMTLGSRIAQKYRNLSVIITEQLNLYLKMEQKPHKKEELLVANNVLKLASDLLKELENPFKISTFASNPYFYNVIRLVILSAFSGVLSEILGFKLKLYKIKLK